MIKVNDISKMFGDQEVFQNISFTINRTDKVGIVGANGAGKSTLLKCMLLEDYPTSGYVIIKGSIGYIEQTKLLDDKGKLFDQYIQLFPKLYSLYNYLNKEEKHITSLDEYVNKSERFHNEGGYDFKLKVDKLLTGFGFQKEDIDRKISSFSGGEKTKLSLIKLLLLEPDYLFLDEPTNHLDLNSIVWLEKYLKSLKKSIILVSHDEVFLNTICNKIIDVENGEIKLYKTNYNNYVKQKKLNFENESRTYENQISLISKYEEFIIKNRGTPSKIGQVNDRKSKIEKIKKLSKPKKIEYNIKFEFEGYHLKKSTYIDLFDVSVGYDNKILLKDINLKIYGGEKIAIIGKNGIGKTTFFQALLNKKGLSGKIKIPSNIKVGYFDQEHDKIDKNTTLYDLIYNHGKFDSQSSIRKYLSLFLFKKDDCFKKFKDLSGGQKVRMTLALISLEKYDILLLDEPTNHLDLEIKTIFINALKKFPGTLIFITHDRKLISEVANKIFHFHDQRVSDFSGNWEEYQELLKVSSKNNNSKISKEKQSSKKSVLKSKKINQQRLEKIEEQILEYEEQQQKLSILLQDEQIYKDYKKTQEIVASVDEITKKLSSLYQDYNDIFS